MPIDDLRIHAAHEPKPRPNGEFILYWLQGVTLRTRDNFALAFAIEQANLLGLPVLAYQGLRSDYPWASDRFHTFILESAIDLAQRFARLGIQYACYLETSESQPSPGVEHSPLLALGRRAALVVTDFFPTFIQPDQLSAIRLRLETPVIAVDSATLVPLAFHDQEYRSARSIRPVLQAALPRYLRSTDPTPPKRTKSFDLPFESSITPNVDPSAIAPLVAGCPIDHSVAPSPVTRGGTKAGRARLRHFLARGLPRYQRDRNDPNADATSRLSPYLHFGNLSIQEILLAARHADTGINYQKFEDEALTWRELSHNLAFMNPRHRTIAAVPAWARQELRDHSADPRPHLYRADQLETGSTSNELWNACQRSLLRDGELSGYLRMLWGKALIRWTRRPVDALRIAEHLNNKYALDGRDPNSYGGILWCFGRYDRPFPRRPIYGTVRYLSLDAQRDKFDVDAYLERYPPIAAITGRSKP